MSQKIVTQIAIRDMKLCEDALKNLGHEYEKKNDALIISRNYVDITIKEDQNITCDSMDKNMVTKIKVEYGKLHAIREIENRGEPYEMTENANEIILTVN